MTQVEINGRTYCVETLIFSVERLTKEVKASAEYHRLVLEQIRDEIDRIEINGQVDEHTMFIRSGEQVKQMALNIIDKYKGDKE